MKLMKEVAQELNQDQRVAQLIVIYRHKNEYLGLHTPFELVS